MGWAGRRSGCLRSPCHRRPACAARGAAGAAAPTLTPALNLPPTAAAAPHHRCFPTAFPSITLPLPPPPPRRYRFNMFLRDLLGEKARDIFRSKGVLCIKVGLQLPGPPGAVTWSPACLPLRACRCAARLPLGLALTWRTCAAAPGGQLWGCGSTLGGPAGLLPALLSPLANLPLLICLLAPPPPRRARRPPSLCSRACTRQSALGPPPRAGRRASSRSTRSCSSAATSTAG